MKIKATIFFVLCFLLMPVMASAAGYTVFNPYTRSFDYIGLLGCSENQIQVMGANGWACGSPGAASMVYPGAGVALSTGSAWGTSYTSSNKFPTNLIPDLSAVYSVVAHNHDSVYEPTDADLSAIAALTCTEDQIIKRNGAGAWVCGADANTGSATAINDIGDAAADGTIDQTGYKQTFTSTLNTAGSVWTMTNTTADLTADVSFLDLKYTDDGDANGYFLRGYDNAGGDLKFSIGADGAATFGAVTATSYSTGSTATPTLTLSDSDNAAGTGGIYANSGGGANDIVLTIGVEDSTGESTPYIQVHGVNETVNILKPLALSTNSITTTGSLAATGARVTKGWFTDVESTNMPTVGGTVLLTSLTAPQFTTIELGHASDTTLSRVSAGVIAVEDVNVAMVGGNIGAASGTSLSLSGNLTGLVPPVVLTIASGVHDGDNDAAIMTDSGESFTTSSMVGMTVYNVTDASSCTVTANDGTTITCTLAGGTDNNWDTSDVWQVGPGPNQSGSVFYVGAASTIRHPTTVGYVAAYSPTTTGVLTVEVADAMTLTACTAAAVDAGDTIDSPATAYSLSWVHNLSATVGVCHGQRGTWVDGGAT